MCKYFIFDCDLCINLIHFFFVNIMNVNIGKNNKDVLFKVIKSIYDLNINYTFVELLQMEA